MSFVLVANDHLSHVQALTYINSLGLVHCDVKPENILLSNYERAEVKLIDFGSSCFLTDRLTTYTQSRCVRYAESVVRLLEVVRGRRFTVFHDACMSTVRIFGYWKMW